MANNKNLIQEYWQDRNERTFLAGENDILKVAEELQANYKKAIKRIEDQINIFYGKYASEEKMDISQAKALLNKSELKSFKEELEELIQASKKLDLSDSYQRQLKLLKFKTKISRLEELKTQINYEIENLTKQVENKMESSLIEAYEDGYYKTLYNAKPFIKIEDNFVGLNKKAVEKAIKTPYMTENYSKALWKNETNLKLILEQSIPQGLTMGYNPRKLADMVSKKLNTNYNSTVRLIRTEYNLILNDATYEGYKDCGIGQYQILATLDDRTSEICYEMNGDIYDLSEKEVGVTYPPFHPNCRTTTVPYFKPDKFDKEWQKELDKWQEDRLGFKPDNMSYKEFKENLKIL